MTHDHEHHHHHDENDDHSNDHDHSGEKTEIEKLVIRIEHWISHNTEHMASLVHWRDEVKNMGLEGVSEALNNSAAMLGKSVEELKTALLKIEK